MRISDWSSDVCSSDLIALASPYRGALAEAALAFWQAEGFEVAEVREVETAIAETPGIYALGSTDAGRVAAPLSTFAVDAILTRGTRMPSSAERRIGHECVSTCRSLL